MDTLLSLCLASLPATTPGNFAAAWSFAPQVVIPLLAALGLYAEGLRRTRAGGGHVEGYRVACFAGGWTILALTLVSPLCRLSATLVAAHMVQHVLIVAVAAPLIVLGAPGRIMAAVWPLRAGERRQTGLAPSPTFTARSDFGIAITLTYGLAIWLWHFPPVYAVVLLEPLTHTLAYALLVALSLLFWTSVIHMSREGHGLRAVPMVLATLIHTGVLGSLLTFSDRIWYPVLAGGAASWGLTPLDDQQLAGLIMWVPMGTLYLFAGLALVAGHLAEKDRDAEAGPLVAAPR